MKFKVEHRTLYEYESPVTEIANEVRLHPVDQPEGSQRCWDFSLVVYPAANIFYYVDYFGNNVHHFSLLASYKKLEIRASSIVETGLETDKVPLETAISLFDFTIPSRFAPFDSSIIEFASQFQDGLRSNPFEWASGIARTINETLEYERGITDVTSTSAEVLALRRGVCQDFAHVMLATCRYLGIPARYVSGYLYGGAATEGEDRASHAWCEVYTGPEKGWLPLDPTSKQLTVDERYIKIGTGRDYADITPVRGIYKGKTKEHLKVMVRISAI